MIPISNFKSDDATAKGEKLLRCKLASCYRLVDMFGWAQGSLGIITVRNVSLIYFCESVIEASHCLSDVTVECAVVRRLLATKMYTHRVSLLMRLVSFLFIFCYFSRSMASLPCKC